MANQNADKGDGWELVSQTDNGLHDLDPAEQPSQEPVDMGEDDE